MNDPLDIYNNSDSDIVCANGTVPASSFLSIEAANAQAWCKDPIVQINVMNSQLGVSCYGVDLGYGFQSAADSWMQRVSSGVAVY